MRQFKIRCSAIGQIMTDPRSKSETLSQTCKAYLDCWIKEQLYDRQNSFSSKYTEKGLAVESDAIDFLADYYDMGLIAKNEKQYENEYLTGTPDVVLSESVDDVKNSFTCFSFPLFETGIPTKDYYWQLQGYMDLTGKSKAGLHYCLMDAPENLIEREAWNRARTAGALELEAELFDQVREEMTYSHLPDRLRIKSFYLERDNFAIQKIYDRVELCREYVAEVIERNGLRDLTKLVA